MNGFVGWLTTLLLPHSSMVPSSRNPVWGEEFDFYAEELPVQVHMCTQIWFFSRKRKLRSRKGVALEDYFVKK